MSDTLSHPSYAFTVNQMIRTYREMARLSQNELAILSMELYNAGLVDRFITQPAIARWEKDPYDGAPAERRVKRLQPQTIQDLAELLALALQRAGFEGASSQELAEYLHAANDRHYNPRQASAFALEVDALMSPWPAWLREIAKENIRSMLISMRAIYERYRMSRETNEE